MHQYGHKSISFGDLISACYFKMGTAFIGVFDYNYKAVNTCKEIAKSSLLVDVQVYHSCHNYL